MVSFIDHYNVISVDRFSSKTKLKKVNGTLLIIFYVGPSSPQPQRIPFLLKTHTKKHSSASGWW